ncbi:MAG: sulfite exporter TauE/SafE family protein [Thermaceae bacterium]
MGVFIGLLAGAFGGLVGLGGGVVMVPLMVRLLNLRQHQAHGTSLVAVAFTGLMGAFSYALQGSVDLGASLLLAVSATLTARLGAAYAHGLSEPSLRRAFGGFLLLVSGLLLLKPYLPSLGPFPFRGWALVLLATGGLTGFLSGMMGVGGGTIMVPAMVLLLGMGQHMAQGSSLLAMVPAGAAGAYAYWRLGNVHQPILPGLVLGVLLGTYLGSHLAHLLPDETLRLVFASVLVWTGLHYLRR